MLTLSTHKMIILYLYKWLSYALTPLLKLYFLWRLRQGKEHPTRWSERWGTPTLLRPKGDLIWVHGASVGESLSALSLLRRLEEAFPQAHFLVTTGTVTSASLLASRLSSRAFHQFMPLDTSRAVNKFLCHWQPNVALWIESELWPNILLALARKNIPTYLLNGRLSEHSFNRWRSIGRSLIGPLLRVFRKVYAQSQSLADQFKVLGVTHAQVAPNLKFASDPLPFNSKDLEKIHSTLSNRTVWLAASTHKGEETWVLQAHQEIAKNIPNILTVIVPRHPHRNHEILQLCTSKGLKAYLRSEYQLPPGDADLYIADTLGELGLFYRLINVVFMGGSLANIGGHNIIEPAHFRCAIVQGPRTHKSREITQQFEEEKALLIVSKGEKLGEVILHLLTSREVAKIQGNAAYELVKGAERMLEHVIDDVKEALGRHEC